LFAALHGAEGTGWPLGSDQFVAELERLTGRRLRRQHQAARLSERTDQLELGRGEIGKVSL
jgi:hypothetical protein